MSCNTYKSKVVVYGCRLHVYNNMLTQIADIPLSQDDLSILKQASTTSIEMGEKAWSFDIGNLTLFNQVADTEIPVILEDNDALFTFLSAARAACACCPSSGGGGGGGSSTFIDLTDTPSAYGSPSQVAVVNSSSTGMAFVDASTLFDLFDSDLDTGISFTEGSNDSLNIHVDGSIIASFSSTKLTLNGLFIDPPIGMEFVPQAVNPAASVGANPTNSIWLNSSNGHLYRGSVDLEATGSGGSTTFGGLTDVTITSPSAGDLYQFNGTSTVNLPIGTAGQVLTVNSGGSGVEWTTAGTGITNLGVANITGTNLDVTSSSGSNTTLPTATSVLAGVMPAIDKAKLDFVSITQAVNLDTLEAQQVSLITLSGMPSNSTALGSFTGSIIPTGVGIKPALQSLETAVEAVSLIGLPDTNITGIGLGDILQWNGTDFENLSIGTAGQILQVNAGGNALEYGPAPSGTTNLGVSNITATGLDVTSSSGSDVTLPLATSTLAGVMPAVDKAKSDFITITQAVDLDAMELDVADLTTLTGVASNATNLGTFTGTTIPDSVDIKTAFQSLETALEASGTGTFVGLTDTPGAMGAAGEMLVVNSGGTALEFVASPTSPPNVQINAGNPSLGTDGDIYFDITDGEWYEQVTGAWVLQDRILPFANAGSDIVATNAEDAIKEVNDKILYLGLFANTGTLPASSSTGSIALVGTPSSNTLYKWDGSAWYQDAVSLWYETRAAMVTAQPTPARGDLAFVGGDQNTGFQLFGCTTPGTWESIEVRGPLVAQTGTVLDMNNLDGTEYGTISTPLTNGTYTLANQINGGYAVIFSNTASEPTITGSTLLSGSAAFTPSVPTMIIVQVIGGSVRHFFIEI